MASNTEKFLAALGNSLMDLSGMTAENGPDAIADALVGGGGANAYGIGSAAGLASTQTGAVMHALTDGDTTGEPPLIHVRRGSANVTYLMPGARWYINHVLGIPWQQSEPGSMLPAGNIASPST